MKKKGLNHEVIMGELPDGMALMNLRIPVPASVEEKFRNLPDNAKDVFGALMGVAFDAMMQAGGRCRSGFDFLMDMAEEVEEKKKQEGDFDVPSGKVQYTGTDSVN